MTLVRYKHGNGHGYKLDGLWALGVTSAIKAAWPTPALIAWAANVTAETAVDRWDELAALSVTERLKLLKGVRFSERDEAARRGTEVHRLAERLLHDEEVEVPEPLTGHVDAYLKFLDDWQVRELLVEVSVARRAPLRYCGTLDLVADLADGNRWLLDVKTTRSGVFAENALQLAAYRFAEFYVDGDGVERPMPEVDRTGVVWVRGDGYDLYPVEAGRFEFGLFQMAFEIARFADRDLRQKLDGRDPIGSPLEPPTKEAPDD